MSFDRTPPQAGQTPIEPAEETLAEVEQAVESGRQQLANARDSALEHARSEGERAQINARFDEINAQFGQFTDRIVTSIESGNERIVETLAGLMGAMQAGQGSANSDADEETAEILSIEEITDALTGGAESAGDAIGAAAGAAAAEIDKAPERGHRLYRKLWGNG